MKSKFPIDRAFELEKKKGDRLPTKIQFWSMLAVVTLSVFYLFINILWILLGAIINPSFFLVYTTAVLTLLTFITTKKS